MHVSNMLRAVDVREGEWNEVVKRKAIDVNVKNVPVEPSNSYRSTAVNDFGNTTASSSFKEMIETVQAVFNLVGMAVSFFRSFFSSTPKPTTVCPTKPSPATPRPYPANPFPDEYIVNPFPVNPSSVNPSPVAPRPTPGKKPDDIWGGFRQGPDGNCVTVSAIKAAMMRFGQKPTDIFEDFKRTGDGYSVVMRDGFKLSFSNAELQLGSRGSQFIGPNKEMLEDARILFTASAKRAQMENNDGTAARSFNQAIKTLNDGEYSREGLLRLGLKNHIKTVPLSALLNGMIGTIERRGHSVAVIEGVEELWGKRGGKPYQPGTITGLV